MSVRIPTAISASGILLAAVALVLASQASANAAEPSPHNPPAPTASEFFLPQPPTTVTPGETVAPAPNQLALQREIAKLASKGHATWIELDASTGLIVAAGSGTESTVSPFAKPTH